MKNQHQLLPHTFPFPLHPLFLRLHSLLCLYEKEKRTYKMTSKLQRKIRSVSETAACAAVEGALDAILFVRKEIKNKEVSLSKGSIFCSAMRG